MDMTDLIINDIIVIIICLGIGFSVIAILYWRNNKRIEKLLIRIEKILTQDVKQIVGAEVKEEVGNYMLKMFEQNSKNKK